MATMHVHVLRITHVMLHLPRCPRQGLSPLCYEENGRPLPCAPASWAALQPLLLGRGQLLTSSDVCVRECVCVCARA